MNNFKSLLAVLTLAVVVSISGLTAQAQNVSLPSLDGQTVSLAGQKGKVVILALGASWLPLSKNQATIANKLAGKYKGRDVVIYFVATDSTSAKSKNYATDAQLQDFATKNKLTVPVLRDSDGAATVKKYKVDQLPSFVILDKQGNQVAEPFGGITPDSAEETLFVNQLSQKIDGIL